jgi:hypothetical protein
LLCEGKDDKNERLMAVPEIPPVVSPQTAVRAAIASGSQKYWFRRIFQIIHAA